MLFNFFKKRTLNKNDVELLKSIKNLLRNLGFGDIYGILGNNQAHLRSLLCDDPHCYEVEDNKPRSCTLNDHDLKSVKALKDNNEWALRYKEEDLYNKLCKLIDNLKE